MESFISVVGTLLVLVSFVQIVVGFFKGSDIPLFIKIVHIGLFVVLEILDSCGALGGSHIIENYLGGLLGFQWLWGCIALKVNDMDDYAFLWGYFLGVIGVIISFFRGR